MIERHLQVRQGGARLVERDVEQVPEVVVIPGVVRRDRERATVARHRGAVVAEQGLGERHQRVRDVVVRVRRDDLAEVQGGPPRIALEAELGEVSVREHLRGVALRRHAEQPLEQGLDDLASPAFVERAFHASSKAVHAVLVALANHAPTV